MRWGATGASVGELNAPKASLGTSGSGARVLNDAFETFKVPNGAFGTYSAGSREPGAGSREPGAGSREPGAGSREPGAGSREP
ncbi:hypothetical protein ACFWX6_13835, partial [Amycolatopsis sp. NPDC059019]|uniref:hypothetical protein n=1 Tax=Amycolatopsis sp. NPDC059019 TaxID=3346702 RepID=UPI00366F5792